jgi:hypothetical protein
MQAVLPEQAGSQERKLPTTLPQPHAQMFNNGSRDRFRRWIPPERCIGRFPYTTLPAWEMR